MKRIIVLTTIFLFIFQISASSNERLIHPPIPENSSDEEQVAIIVLKTNTNIASLLKPYSGLKQRYIFSEVFNGFSVKGPANQIKKLKEHHKVLEVSEVQTYKVEENGLNPYNTDRLGLQRYSSNDLQHRPRSQHFPPGTPGHQRFNPDGPESIKLIGGEKVRGIFDDQDQRLTGRGITIGVIDTGIDYSHPDLKNNYGGGRDLVDNDRDPMETTPQQGQPTLHGTHVAGVIAANGKMKGVAPEARIVAYRALGPGGNGTTEQVLAAIEQAAKDKVDIVNLSLGNSINGPDLPISIALNKLTEKGIVAVTSSGNSGPNKWTVGSPGTASKAISVGASTPILNIPYILIEGIREKIRLEPMVSADRWVHDRSLEIVYGGIGRKKQLVNVKGKIALIKRGELTFTEKAINAQKAGATGVIIFNNTKGDFIGNLQVDVGIPVASISKNAGEQVETLLKKQRQYIRIIEEKEQDVLAAFSSRGPVTRTWEIKPDILAPGVAIQSTVPGGYLSLQGTSMAAPHVAGACALIKQAHPDWTPEQIKAAIMNHSKPLNAPQGGSYRTFEQGAGRIQIEDAAKAESLVSPGSLQFGKFQIADHNHEHRAKLTVKNVSKKTVHYSFDIPKKTAGMSWHMPISFSLAPGGQRQVELQLEVDPNLLQEKIQDGFLYINAGTEKIHLPYIYVLEEPDYPRVMGFEIARGDKEGTMRYQVYLPGGAEEFGIALFHPEDFRFAGFLDWSRNVKKGFYEKEVEIANVPSSGMYVAKVFAKKAGIEDIVETMIEIQMSEKDHFRHGKMLRN